MPVVSRSIFHKLPIALREPFSLLLSAIQRTSSPTYRMDAANRR